MYNYTKKPILDFSKHRMASQVYIFAIIVVCLFVSAEGGICPLLYPATSCPPAEAGYAVFTKCCRTYTTGPHKGCCLPGTKDFSFCPSDYVQHFVPVCPRASDPDDYTLCCKTLDEHGVYTYGCCSDRLVAWAIGLIVAGVVVFIAIVTLCVCCCCSCCWLAQRRQQRGYVVYY